MRAPTTPTSGTSAPARAGFTLLELLAVLLILSILMAVLITSVGDSQRAVEIKATRTQLLELTGAIDEYYDHFSRYPPSSFPADLDPKPSKTNMGIEMLVISLWGRDSDWQAREVPEERLGNTDGDNTRKSLTTFAKAEAFELVDVWGNPLAYINRHDYGEEITYLTYDAENRSVEAPVKAMVSPKTGDPYRKSTFQLISAGPDGVFGTDDDIANFEIERE